MMKPAPNFNIDDIQFPSFGASAATADEEFDFNILSEYLLEDEHNKAGQNYHFQSGTSASSKSPSDVSDKDDYSSGDEQDEKRCKGEDGTKSQDQIDRRRERNRVLARKTRLRKKFFFESLQKQVAQLAAENEMLKGVVRQRVENDSVKSKILADCNAELPPIVASATAAANANLGKNDFNLISAIQTAQRSFVITDPSLPDNPIIFASQGFLELSGYNLEEVLGRNCRFMQGPETDPKQVETLRKGINAGQDVSVCLLNYRADGTKFYNQVFIAALRDANMNIINYVGVQVEIKSKRKASLEIDNSCSDSMATGPSSGKQKKPIASKKSDTSGKAATASSGKVAVKQEASSGGKTGRGGSSSSSSSASRSQKAK